MSILYRSDMQENEFEKQVKNMMGRFKLTPSDSVWEQVNRRLNANKRKKRPFIFLLLFGLLIGGYFMYNYFNGQTHVEPVYTKKVNSNNIKTPGNSSTDLDKATKKIKPDRKQKNKNTDLLYDKNESNKTNNINNIITTKHNLPEPKHLLAEQNNLAEQNSNNNIEATQQQLTAETKRKFDSENVVNNQLPQYNLNEQPAISIDSVKPSPNINKGIVENESSINDSVQINQNKKDNSTQQPEKKTRYTFPKWQWGIMAFYGRSDAVVNLVSSNKSLIDYASTPVVPAGNADTSSRNSNPDAYTASNAFTFGAVVQKKIIKNGFISAGLNFIHLSTKADVNNKIDSAYTIQTAGGIRNAFYVNSFYQPGSSSTHTNTYNFIELPVYFQQDLFAQHKLSFSYNAGFSLRQLISSNALIYSPYNNIYFSKDDLFRKTQLQFMAGLHLRINTGNKSVLYVGPQFSYSLSNLLKNKDNGNFHFINYGLQAQFVLHKR